MGLEVVSELGFVFAWRAIVDPERVLEREGRGTHMADRVAWAQTGSGLVARGSYGGMGVGGLILHRFGMPTEVIARRQYNLSFLKTAVSALTLIVFGVGLATGVFAGEGNLPLTLLPAALAIALSLAAYAERLQDKHPRSPARSPPGQRRPGLQTDPGRARPADERARAINYLGFEGLVLWTAFLAVHAHPVPSFAIVVMPYVIGALAGSIPLPAAIGTVGGIAGMLILYGVDHNPAAIAVLLHQAIGMLVPFTRRCDRLHAPARRLGPLRSSPGDGSGQA
jgi:hypothetical protein